MKRDRELYHTGHSVGLRPGERPGTQHGHEILETGLCASTQRLWIPAQSPSEGHFADEEAQGLKANVEVI